MLKTVPVTSRQLLVVAASDRHAELLGVLQAAGWAVRHYHEDDLDIAEADAALIFLQDEHVLHMQPLLHFLQATETSWVALLEASTLARAETTELSGEWLFATHTLPCETTTLLESLMQARQATQMRQRQRGRPVQQLLGNSSQMRSIRRQLERYASLDSPVMLSGERGTGKRLLAQLLHERSARAGQVFLQLDFTELSARQIEEHCSGRGAGEVGSVLLDGVSKLSLLQQQLLLQWLQGDYAPRALTIDHGELEEAVQQGRLREDLYYLLASLRLSSTPLREQRGDLLLLAEYFARIWSLSAGKRARHFSHEAIAAMIGHNWPGNVRELRNRVLRARVLAPDRQIVVRDLGLSGAEQQQPSVTLEDYILRAERQALNDVLVRYASNMSQAARSLGISRPTFYRLLHKHHLR